MSGTFQGRVAYAKIDFDAGVPFIASQSGDFSETVTDNGVGDLTLTLTSPIDPEEAVYLVSAQGPEPHVAVVNSPTSTSIQILITLAGVPKNQKCDLCILVKPTV